MSESELIPSYSAVVMKSSNTTTCEPLYVVRQHWLCFVAFIAGGALFLVMPWVSNFEPWSLWMGLFVSMLGLPVLLLGIHGLRTQRIAVVLNAVGLHPKCLTGSTRIVPWCEVSGIKKVSFTSPEGTHEGVVVGLKSAAHFPYDSKYAEEISRGVRMLVPAEEFDVWFVLTHEEWDWNIDEFLNVAQRCLSDHGGGYQPS